MIIIMGRSAWNRVQERIDMLERQVKTLDSHTHYTDFDSLHKPGNRPFGYPFHPDDVYRYTVPLSYIVLALAKKVGLDLTIEPASTVPARLADSSSDALEGT
jgi:hypothetical protein